MKLYFLGICGTFMAGIAQIAKSLGHEVSGCDENIYPPMDSQLQRCGIRLDKGYHAENLPEDIDCVIVGNAMKRGLPIVEKLLNSAITFQSAPQWLAQHVLKNYQVITVSGTHGKTTTTSMIAWILTYAGLNPGYLVAGVPQNLSNTAALGDGQWFVIEADEYDCAFFDKQPKFIHYHPQVAVLTNLEFDHADIYANLEQIKQQFHYLIRTVPGKGKLVINHDDNNLSSVIDKGCWSKLVSFGATDHCDFQILQDNQRLSIQHQGNNYHTDWSLTGFFNQENAAAAIAACYLVGVDIDTSLQALAQFKSVKRRMELITSYNSHFLYDDFAHHPSAIAATLVALRQRHPTNRLIAVVEMRSYTMRQGHHSPQDFEQVFANADVVYVKNAALAFNSDNCFNYSNDEVLLKELPTYLSKDCTIVYMNNKANAELVQSISSLLQ